MKLLTLKAVFWTTFRGTQHKCFNDYLLLMYKQSYIQSYCLILETVNVSEAGDKCIHGSLGIA